MSFLRCWSSEHRKQRFLRVCYRKSIVVMAVHHQERHFNARSEIDLICNPQRWLQKISTVQKNCCFQTALEKCNQNHTVRCSDTGAPNPSRLSISFRVPIGLSTISGLAGFPWLCWAWAFI